MQIKETIALRVTRNHDYDLHENEVMDLLKSVESEIKDRTHQIAVRLEIVSDAPKKTIRMLETQLGILHNYVFEIKGPINFCDLLSLHDLPVPPQFKDPPFNPRIPQKFATNKDIFTIIREGDLLVHHPYDSFAVVMDFLNRAAEDPDVLAIKQTLYRIGNDSPVVSALCRAAENGKQVTAVVELKARFDEQYNIDWTRQMTRAGVNVVYGFVKWKIHCKATLVVRMARLYLTVILIAIWNKTLGGFRFDEVTLPAAISPDYLRSCEFVNTKTNLVMYGNVGTGKTFLSIALGVEACKKGIETSGTAGNASSVVLSVA